MEAPLAQLPKEIADPSRYFDHYQSFSVFREYLLQSSNDHKGKVFEHFVKDFFLTAEFYSTGVKYVYFAREHPELWKELGVAEPKAKEVGIDLILRYHDGTLGIVQAKCYLHTDTLVMEDLSGFWFMNGIIERSRVPVNNRYVASTCSYVSPEINAQDNGVQFLFWKDLTSDPHLLEKIKTRNCVGTKPPFSPVTLLRHQENAIFHMKKVFFEQNGERALILHSCGTGKTMIGVAIGLVFAGIYPEDCRIVLYVPTIALASQTVRYWKVHFRNSSEDYAQFLVVSSERDPDDRSYTTTTDNDTITAFLKGECRRKVVICVYKSSPRLANHHFHLGIYDEAHRAVTKESAVDYLCVDSKLVFKKVFFTATPRISKIAGYRSMDRVEQFGLPNYYPLNEAIEDGILNDYEVCLIEYGDGVTGDSFTHDGVEYPGVYGLCTKAIHDAVTTLCRRKVVTFHNTKKNANLMAGYLRKIFAFVGMDVPVDVITGEVTGQRRKRMIERFSSAKVAVLCSVDVLKEGVDIPCIDVVVFCDAVHLASDIMQRIGRCSRRMVGKQHSLVIVPYSDSDQGVPEEEGPGEEGHPVPQAKVPKSYGFFLDVLKALAEVDCRIADEVSGVSATKKISLRRFYRSIRNSEEIVKLEQNIQEAFLEIKMLLLTRKLIPIRETEETRITRDFEVFTQYCDALGDVPLNAWPKGKVLNPRYKREVIDYIAFQKRIRDNYFNKLSNEQKWKLWCYPSWMWKKKDEWNSWWWMLDLCKAFKFNRGLPAEIVGFPFPMGGEAISGDILNNNCQHRLARWIGKAKNCALNPGRTSPEQLKALNTLLGNEAPKPKDVNSANPQQRKTMLAIMHHYNATGNKFFVNEDVYVQLCGPKASRPKKGTPPGLIAASTAARLLQEMIAPYGVIERVTGENGRYQIKMLVSEENGTLVAKPLV